MKFCSGGEKMRIAAATGVKMSDNDISSIKCVTRKFLEVEMYKKGVLHVQSCQLGPILIIFFFYRFRCHRHLALHDFIFCLCKL